MRPGASPASVTSPRRDNLDALDVALGTKVVPRRWRGESAALHGKRNGRISGQDVSSEPIYAHSRRVAACTLRTRSLRGAQLVVCDRVGDGVSQPPPKRRRQGLVANQPPVPDRAVEHVRRDLQIDVAAHLAPFLTIRKKVLMSSTAQHPGPPPRHRMALLVWLAIYPTITLLLALGGGLIADWPLPLRTLALSVSPSR
jgi:hypothetical protein